MRCEMFVILQFKATKMTGTLGSYFTQELGLTVLYVYDSHNCAHTERGKHAKWRRLHELITSQIHFSELLNEIYDHVTHIV